MMVKTRKPKPEIWWVVKSRNGVLCPWTAAPSAPISRMHFVDVLGLANWAQARNKGYRCVKIKVVEA